MADNARPTSEQELALGRMVEQATISAEQANAMRSVLWGAKLGRGRVNPAIVLIEVAGYVGGALMLGGAISLLGLSWSQLSRGAHIALLVAVSVALTGAAWLVGGGPARFGLMRDGSAPVRRRLVGVLFALGAAPAGIAVGVATDHYQPFIGAAVGFVVAAVGYALVPTALGLLFTATASLGVSLGASEFMSDEPILPPWWPTFVLGLAWAAATLLRLATPRTLGWVISGAITILGAQFAVFNQTNMLKAYTLTLAVALAAFLLYWREGSSVLLAAGVVAATIGVPEAVSDWTDGALSAPTTLLIAGAVLVSTSVLGLLLRGARHSS